VLFPALVALLAAFVLLFVFRVGGARRRLLMDRWPAVLLAGAALFALARAQIWPALALALLAVVAWRLWPALNSRSQNQQRATADAADIEACAALGVTLDAGEHEVRRAYREKMARAHPDRGGAHAEAARLTAARDRLLRRLRG
jgi:hypothetical protein